MGSDTFRVLFLIARPAAGKSEIINYLKCTPETVRRGQFHIGRFAELDDFPMLWAWFEEDAILEQMGRPRLHTTPDQSFLDSYFWDVLIERLNLEYAKLLADEPDFHTADGTVIVEFARGREHGGFGGAFGHVAPELLHQGAILYVDVSWQESLRKNRARYNPARPHSILQHGLSDARLEQLYRESDWVDFRGLDPGFIRIQGIRVPYAVFENEDDVTTGQGKALGERLEFVLNQLWARFSSSQNRIASP